jgi:ribosomal protein L37AE/L43A
MLSHARRGHPAESDIRLQVGYCAHFPRQIPLTQGNATPRRQCKVCSAKRLKSTSRWECERCEVALHIPGCFKIYHMQQNFQVRFLF